MNISIVLVNETSKYLTDVIQLGDNNSDTLGFFSKGAFNKAAKEGLIIAAISEHQQCIGYLLYRIVKTKHRAAITHLCVHKDFRRKGVGLRLFNHMVESTKHLHGISLFCRRDYESNKFWARIGFEYKGEKTGRGRDQIALTHYWYDHGHPDLFTFAAEDQIQSKSVMAVIDTNIFFELYDNPQHALLADWLTDDLAICVTPELSNEINRKTDREKRSKSLDYSQRFLKIAAKDIYWKPIEAFLRQFYTSDLKIQDESDIRQLAQAIAASAQFFVTNDIRLRNRLSEVAKMEFGITIVSPDDLIIYLDEKMNEAVYQPSTLAGASILMTRLKFGQSDYLAEIFHRQSGERKFHLRKQLSEYLENPHEFETFVVSSGDSVPLAVFVLSTNSSPIASVPLIRINQNVLSPSIASHLLSWCVLRSASMGKEVVCVKDQKISENIEQALQLNSFVEKDGQWFKICISGIYPTSEIYRLLKCLGTKINLLESIAQSYCLHISNALSQKSEKEWVAIEKGLWPLKISDAAIQTYIVPISPTWAMDLFDTKLGSQTLFGSDPSLALRMENVYYRSAHTKVPVEHSRVLWYVSRGYRQQNQGVMAIRACSYVDEQIVAPPKELFKQFSKLGVYRWQNVLHAAKNDINHELLAFRFSRTELFEKPVTLEQLKHLQAIRSAPQSPMATTSDAFESIYRLGTAYITNENHVQ